MILVMPEKVTWKSVFFIWLLAMPFMAGAGYVAYQKYPVPFQVAAKWSIQQAVKGQKAATAYKAKWDADRKAKAEKARKEAEAAALEAGY
jgi:hypothetical protein